MEILWVALGGAIGAVARFLSYKMVGPVLMGGFPVGTLFVNVIGSFLFGLFLPHIKTSPNFGLFFAVGLLGAFTTFSTFSFESVQLLREGKTQIFILNILANVALGFLALALGAWLSGRSKLI